MEVFEMQAENKRKLRIGLLLDSLSVPAWIYFMLENIKKSNFAEINLVILNKNEKTRIITPNFFEKFENKRFVPTPISFEMKNAEELVANIPTLNVSAINTELQNSFSSKDVENVASYNLDVLIQLGFGILTGQILQTPKFGVWAFYHGKNNFCNSFTGFWEIIEKNPVTDSTLRKLETNTENKVLASSYTATDVLSVNRTRNRIYWKNPLLLTRTLKQLYEIGTASFFLQLKNTKNQFLDNTTLNPTTGDFRKIMMEVFKRNTKTKYYNKVFFDQWILMFKFSDVFSNEYSKFQKIIPTKDRFWADPHIVYRDNQYYIFMEEFLNSKNKSYISLFSINNDGSYTKPEKILERPYSLSYPFVFQHDAEFFMIPESNANRTIELYRCTEFPKKWKFEKNIMENISAVDATLFFHKNTYWLFVGIAENESISTSDELFLFYSESPLNDNWTPHPQNPIVSDVRRARSAGKIFEHDGKIYRPAQDCSHGYGYKVTINQIVTLSKTEYQEKEFHIIDPTCDSKLTGIHTFNHEEKLTMLDGKLKRRKL